MTKLKHHVHFVCPDDVVWPELQNWDGTKLDDQVLSDRSGGILHSWLLRTYYQLTLVGEKLTVSSQLRPDAINFVSVRDFGRRQRDMKSFIVAPQGDAHHSQIANFRILQNGVRGQDPMTSVVWHWPQPGIIPRDPARQDRVTQLCYKGRLLNLDEAFRSETFTTELQNLGVSYEIDAYNGLRGEHNWNDYRHSDAVLAVRNLTVYDAAKKPASKLVNAWFADLPAILGPEPAYRELGTSGEDYIEVRTPRDALDALAALKDNPDLYRKIVENGRKQREKYTEPALTTLWIDILNGPVSDAFEAWQQTSVFIRTFSSLKGILKEGSARTKDQAAFAAGARLLDAVE